MPDFKNIEYLKQGNQKQQIAYKELSELFIFQKLKEYTPTLCGTIPIAIDTDESDLDIICYCNNLSDFKSKITGLYIRQNDFEVHEKVNRNLKTIVARFSSRSFTIELFGQNRPVEEQEAYRHMLIEHKILLEKGETFRQHIIMLKKQGFKTEPAFAKLLGITGDPYIELLKL